MLQMPSIWCQEGSYFKNFVVQVGTSCNSSPLFRLFYAFEFPLFYNHHNYEGYVIIIPFAMGTCQRVPLGGVLFGLAHFGVLHSTTSHFSSFLFPSIVNDTHIMHLTYSSTNLRNLSIIFSNFLHNILDAAHTATSFNCRPSLMCVHTSHQPYRYPFIMLCHNNECIGTHDVVCDTFVPIARC
jgi:hypothetical protein